MSMDISAIRCLTLILRGLRKQCWWGNCSCVILTYQPLHLICLVFGCFWSNRCHFHWEQQSPDRVNFLVFTHLPERMCFYHTVATISFDAVVSKRSASPCVRWLLQLCFLRCISLDVEWVLQMQETCIKTYGNDIRMLTAVSSICHSIQHSISDAWIYKYAVLILISAFTLNIEHKNWYLISVLLHIDFAYDFEPSLCLIVNRNIHQPSQQLLKCQKLPRGRVASIRLTPRTPVWQCHNSDNQLLLINTHQFGSNDRQHNPRSVLIPYSFK